MRYFILVCTIFACSITFGANTNKSVDYKATIEKNLNELRGYKWWLKYETTMLVLRAALDDKDVSDEVKKAWIKVESAKDVGHQVALCFIEEKGKTYIMEPIYNLSLKEHTDMMKEERAVCIKDLPTDLIINDFTKDYYTITGPSLLKEVQKLKLDIKTAPCPFKYEYFIGDWKYLEKSKRPKINSNQKLLTIIGLSRDCVNGNIRYYVGESLKKPKK